MANAEMGVDAQLRRWLNAQWCQQVTGEPLPQFQTTPGAFRAGLWNETATAYCAVLRQLGIKRDEQQIYAIQQEREGSPERAEHTAHLAEAYAEQLCAITQVGESLTPLAAQRSGHLNAGGANLALGALLESSGVTVTAAESRFEPALLIPLTPKAQLFVRIDSVAKESIPALLTCRGQTLAPGITYYRPRRRVGGSSIDLPPVLWKVPLDQAALHAIGNSVTFPLRASAAPDHRIRRTRECFLQMAQVLCPVINELRRHPTWQAEQHAYQKDLDRCFVFSALTFNMQWEAVEHYALSGVMDRYQQEIFRALLGESVVPSGLQPGLAEKIKAVRDTLLAGRARPELQRVFDHIRHSRKRGEKRL